MSHNHKRVVTLAAFAAVMLLLSFVLAGHSTAQGSEPSGVSSSGGGEAALHGPFEVTAADMLKRVAAAQAVPQFSPIEMDDMLIPKSGYAPAPFASQAGMSADLFSEALSPAAQSPAATSAFTATGAQLSCCPPDPNVAAGLTYVAVTGQGVLAFYNKAGQVVLPEQSVVQFFQPLSSNLFNSYGIDGMGDLRVIYDSYRGRFWVGAMSANTNAAWTPQRRSKIVVAVSKTDNPLDGWWQYYWDGPAHDGTNDGVDQLGDDTDYPSFGIDSCCIYSTNKVANNSTVSGNHVQVFRYWHVDLFPATTLANGTLGSGWQYWDLTNPNSCSGTQTPATVGVIQPVVHHGPTTRGFLASRCDANKVVVWAVNNELQNTQTVQNVAVAVNPYTNPVDAPQPGTTIKIEMTNLGTDIMKGVFRNNQLYMTGFDAYNQAGYGTLDVNRVLRFDVSAFPGVTVPVDRAFGTSAAGDPPGSYTHYGWPSMEVNKNGDMAIVYMRSGNVVTPEIRYNAYFAADADISPSRLLRKGDALYTLSEPLTSTNSLRYGDLSGASVDPYDDTSIWLTHEFPDKPVYGYSYGFQLWVAKVFGSQHPDLSVGDIRVNGCCTTVKTGSTYTFTVDIWNQGDGNATAGATVGIYISKNPVITPADTKVGQFTLGALSSGATFTTIGVANIPIGEPTGKYYVGAYVDPGALFEDYNRTNNSLHAPYQITVVAPKAFLPFIKN